MHWSRFSCFLALALLLLAAPGYAQQERAAGEARVVGYVLDRSSGAPLDATVIELPDAGLRVLTNAEGRFVLTGLTQGSHEVRVRRLGYEEYRTTWRIEQDLTTLTIAMGVRPVVLEGVTVQSYPFVRAIERRRLGYGYSSRTIPRTFLQHTAARDAGEAALQFGGLMRVPCPASSFDSDCVLVRGRRISPRVYIDERPAFGLSELQMYPATDLFMIEIFSGGAMIRAYTSWFIENEGRRGRQVLMPLSW